MNLNKSKGISLIVLIVTIIVIIILAAVVILTLSKNNPIESAKEARFKEDVRTFQDELALTVSKQYTTADGHRDEKITTSDFDEIKEYISSFSEKYRDKFIIQDDELKYTNKLDDNEKEYAQSINVREKNKLLPDEYQQVEYIESTGTQYIDTNFKGNQDTKITCESVISDEFKSGYYQGLFGATDVNVSTELNRNVIHMHRASASNLIIMAAYGSKIKIIGFSGDITKKHIYELDKNIYKIDNEIIYSYPMQTFMCTQNINIFRDNNSYMQDKRYCNMKLYSFKIYDNESLIRNFIPCYRNTDNIIGLYDTVEGKFYTNQGDKTKGDFIPGPEVN